MTGSTSVDDSDGGARPTGTPSTPTTSRWKRRTVLAVGIAVCSALAIVGLLVATVPWRGPALPPHPTDPVADRHLPADPIVNIKTGAAGWHTFVFVSIDDQICGGSASTTRSDLSVACWMRVTQASTGTWVALPAFQTLPAPSDNGNKVLIMGLLRCQATSVDVTFHDQTFAAALQPVPVHGHDGLSVYTTWLPLNGTSTYGTSDITKLTAKDGGATANCPMLASAGK